MKALYIEKDDLSKSHSQARAQCKVFQNFFFLLQAFVESSKLKRHQLVHTGEKPFQVRKLVTDFAYS